MKFSKTDGAFDGSYPGRILMLVPHEPTEDPRIGWVVDLCKQVARTDILGCTFSTALVARQYDGTVYTERVNIAETASPRTKRRAARMGSWMQLSSVDAYVRREGRSPVGGALRTLGHHRAALIRHMSNDAVQALLTDSLYRRGRSVSIRPRLIICHDLLALAAGVKLKRLFHSRLLYDSHEFWPEADLMSQPWEHRLVSRFERELVRAADAVVTVSPLLAKRLESLYGIDHVISCPNAAPFVAVPPSDPQPATDEVKFLVQGRLTPRRGYDELFAAWERVRDTRAVLYVRCPASEHLQVLRSRHRELERAGRVVYLPPVSAEDLVSAATFADVGLITYPSETKAHLEACPNKLSQFMHSGLAILTNQLPYVQQIIRQADCGTSFDLNDPSSLVAAITRIVNDRDGLARMKRNARAAGESWFNWQHQSVEYRDAIEKLFHSTEVDLVGSP